jgi:large subunit ribosomal protein L32
MRHTRSHTGNRRSHHALKAPALSKCTNCGALHRPHHMCLECGFYKGKVVVDMAAKKQARAARMEAKKAMIAEQSGLPTEAAPAVVDEKADAPEEKKAKKVKKTK